MNENWVLAALIASGTAVRLTAMVLAHRQAARRDKAKEARS